MKKALPYIFFTCSSLLLTCIVYLNQLVVEKNKDIQVLKNELFNATHSVSIGYDGENIIRYDNGVPTDTTPYKSVVFSDGYHGEGIYSKESMMQIIGKGGFDNYVPCSDMREAYKKKNKGAPKNAIKKVVVDGVTVWEEPKQEYIISAGYGGQHFSDTFSLKYRYTEWEPLPQLEGRVWDTAILNTTPIDTPLYIGGSDFIRPPRDGQLYIGGDNHEYYGNIGIPATIDGILYRTWVEFGYKERIKTCEDYKAFRKDFPNYYIDDKTKKAFELKYK